MLTDVIEIHFIEMEKFRKLGNKNLKGDKFKGGYHFLEKI